MVLKEHPSTYLQCLIDQTDRSHRSLWSHKRSPWPLGCIIVVIQITSLLCRYVTAHGGKGRINAACDDKYYMHFVSFNTNDSLIFKICRRECLYSGRQKKMMAF